MNITDFTRSHVEAAVRLARECYARERAGTPALPAALPDFDLLPCAENGLGVAALSENGDLLGYLCSVSPFENTFGSTGARGVFSPMHANGAVERSHGALYERMLGAAQGKWARAGAVSHAVCLYAHDDEAQETLFRCGFGLRCLDAIRPAAELPDIPPCPGLTFRELAPREWALCYPLNVLLDRHMAAPPTFLLRPTLSQGDFLQGARREGARFFAALEGELPVAFLKLSPTAETLVSDAPEVVNVAGAYCLESHRGRYVYPNLLNAALRAVQGEGFTHLGVDYESINPTALHFWPKYFSPYTHSLVRRIDEKGAEGV